MPVRPRAAVLWRCALATLVLTAACGSDDGAVVPVPAAGYTAIIDDFLPPIPADGSRPVIYVARLADEPFALDQQVAMIEAVEQGYDLRFVDDASAALDDENPDAPLRDDGLLLGVGTISAAAPYVARVEVYTGAGPIDAHKVTLTVRDDVWRVVATEPVDPEVLLGDE